MIPARYLWKWEQPDETLAAEWSKKLGIPLLAARVLAARGWREEEAALLLQPAQDGRLSDPLQMKGMAIAAARIRQAVGSGERIRVYGDYDADGVTSTALMIRVLTQLGAHFDTYIPHRSLEGYGLNLGAIDSAKEAGVSLIVTVDNGISAVEQIAYAKNLGIDVVVTDHHEPPAVLPEAAALVNPKQPGCPYPFKGLCGAGVAFRLAEVLLGRVPYELTDLAAIGTIADLMPLVGENRLLVRLGLERMRREPSAGVRALCEVGGFEPAKLSSGRIGFALAPRLNAGGRLERADGAVKLMTTEDPAEAKRLALELDRLNGERQRLVDVTAEEAERLWQERKAGFGGDGPSVIVLAQEGWNAGIAGLVASKLVERHYRPAVVLAKDPETGLCKGSARSIDGFDIYEALTECADCLEHFGGHQAAAGMTLRAEMAGELEERLHRIASERLLPEDWLPKKRADLVCSLEEATLEAAEALAGLEPFGNGFPVPRLILENVTVRETRLLGKDGKHIRVAVGQGACQLEAVGFGLGDLAGRLGAGRNISLLGELGVNEWNGTRRVQFMIQDVRCDELLWMDRRESTRVWAEIRKLAAEKAGKLLVLCASPGLAGEAADDPGLRELTVASYSELQGMGLDSRKEIASATESGGRTVKPLRTLALVGLPDHVPDQERLAELLSAETGWEAVYVFAGQRNRRERPDPDLNREDFARVYALFRELDVWIDGPEGQLRRIAERSGLPLASVRLIQEVFEELGFIRARGAERSMIANPPKRKLEESGRYIRMMRQAEAASFPYWPVEKLKEWGERIRARGIGRSGDSRGTGTSR